ncbi:MAG: hypothetical protein K8R41_04040 [Bacteroidales bacterium]|nr:hypothetical protein [Bacteroidales bacterium]
MIRALKLEWLKVKNYRVFWILMVMYLVALLIIASAGGLFLEWLKYQGADFNGIDPTILPIFDFPDIWQNITYLSTFVKIFLAFIVIISVNNDQSYSISRQNIIDGFSKNEYIASKMMMIFAIALLSTLFVFLAGLINGSIYSHVWSISVIFDELEFLAVYLYEIIVYCSLAFLLSLIIKKAGFVIVALLLYTMMFEPIAVAIFENAPYFRDGIMPELAQYFPIKSLNNLIKVPFGRYLFIEIEDNVSIKAIAITFGWFVFYLSSIVYILYKRDLK